MVFAMIDLSLDSAFYLGVKTIYLDFKIYARYILIGGRNEMKAKPSQDKPTNDPTGTHVWLVLMKAHRSMQRHAAASIASLDLGLSDFVVLEMLLHKGPMKVNDIGRKVDLTSGSITTAVDRLQARGLVSREVNREDSRSRIVQLTAKGNSLIRAAFGAHAARLEQAAGGLNAKQRRELIALLKKLGLEAQAQLDTEGNQGEKDE
jgi:MarR family 2-MHQ and catechol resistance regulon transcriptional repressor